MGSWYGNRSRCYSAPHMWTAGWATPATMLSAPSELAAGMPAKLLVLPEQTAAEGATTGIKLVGGVDAMPAFALR